jgi:hypothetical protein
MPCREIGDVVGLCRGVVKFRLRKRDATIVLYVRYDISSISPTVDYASERRC